KHQFAFQGAGAILVAAPGLLRLLHSMLIGHEPSENPRGAGGSARCSLADSLNDCVMKMHVHSASKPAEVARAIARLSHGAGRLERRGPAIPVRQSRDDHAATAARRESRGQAWAAELASFFNP